MVVTLCEAQDSVKLLKLIERYYITDPTLVETFNKRPSEFDFNRYMAECP